MGSKMRGEKRKEKTKKIADLKLAIKLKCYECMCGQKKIDCKIEDCHLYPYRPFK